MSRLETPAISMGPEGRAQAPAPARLVLAAALAACLATGASDARAQSGPRPADWERRPSSGAKLDRDLMARAYLRAERMGPLTSLLVARHGELAAASYWRGLAPGQPVNVKSVSKTILSGLVGIALEQGHLEGLGQTVDAYLPEYFGPATDPRKRRITLRHLLTMTSGLETTSFYNYGSWVAGDDWVEGALDQPMVAEPGTRMIYSTGSAHLMGVILRRATGTSLRTYAQRHLFDPLGVRLDGWQRDPDGHYFGGNNMALSPRELLKFGQLYLYGGVYRGRRVLPTGWVTTSWRARVVSDWNGFDYGYYWWGRRLSGHPVRFAWGYGGQFLFVVPDLELVVVATSDPGAPGNGSTHRRAIYRLLADYLIPAAERAG